LPHYTPRADSQSTGLAKSAGFCIAVMLLTGIMFPVIWLAAPRLQGFIAPIVKASFVAGSVMRNDRTLCWDVDFVKLRVGIPEYINFFVVSGRDRVPLAAYKPGGPLLSTFAFENRPPGSVWTSRYCVALPPLIQHDALDIQGLAIYQTWNPFWPTQQAMPEFEVPALN
jgi:hypothetical protein